ncbi:hypothetical protein [Rhodococcus sp. UNC363MFTsu5.1]|uniref:hypothetical protein n=1 Tax=Rhodococcus sp. UNC363MFTsu5.1 TaxID=1449069 RepID=UPI00068BF763|nr:hypothetical protein [Rhodococcus sp. UNC363MFTsu5.1]
MARSHGRIQFGLFNNREFRALSPGAQRTYMVLFGQKDVNNAGVLPLMPSRWARYCEGLTEADVWADLAELQAARFIYFDTDSDELLIRSFIRGDGIEKQPNVLKNALKCAELIDSPLLRQVLAAELRKLRRKDADAVADMIEPDPSGRVSEPFPNPSETLPEPLNPSRTPREPRGVGEGEEVLLRTADEELGGRARVHTHTREAQPPTPHCPKHPQGTDAPCRACGAARQAREAWDLTESRRRIEVQRAEREKRVEAAKQAIAACALCDDEGYAGTTVCDHDPDVAERNRRGSALVRAALAQSSTQNATEGVD